MWVTPTARCTCSVKFFILSSMPPNTSFSCVYGVQLRLRQPFCCHSNGGGCVSNIGTQTQITAPVLSTSRWDLRFSFMLLLKCMSVSALTKVSERIVWFLACQRRECSLFPFCPYEEHDQQWTLLFLRLMCCAGSYSSDWFQIYIVCAPYFHVLIMLARIEGSWGRWLELDWMSVLVLWLSSVNKAGGLYPWACVLACVHGKGTLYIEETRNDPYYCQMINQVTCSSYVL